MQPLEQFKKRTDYLIVVSLLVVGLGVLLYVAYSTVMAVLLGIFFAMVSSHAISRMRTYLGQGHTVTFILFWSMIAAGMFLLFALMANRISLEFSGFYGLIVEAFTSTQEGSLRQQINTAIPFLTIEDIQGLFDNNQLITQIQNFFSNGLAVLGYMSVVLFIAIYGSLNAKAYGDHIHEFVPKRYRDSYVSRSKDLSATLSYWFGGRIISMLVVGILTYAALLILQVPFALAVAIMAALLSFIPNIGPILSVIPAVFIAIIAGVSVWWVLIVFLVIQTVESYFVTPYVQQRFVDIPPTILLIAQVLAGVVFGLLGVIVVEPLLAVVIHMMKTEHN